MLIVGICGSLRRESWNRKLLTQATALLPDGWDYDELVIGDLPLINEDLEGAGWPDAVGKLRARIGVLAGIGSGHSS